MERNQFRITLLLVVAVALLVVFVCTAAPIKVGPRISNEVRSLAGLDELDVMVFVRSKVLEKSKYSGERVKQKIISMLAASGINVVDGSDGPVLQVVILSEINSEFPELVAYTCHITLEQEVVVKRLQQTLAVPTYSLVHVDITSADRVEEDLENFVPDIVRHFIERVKLATNIRNRS